jgi:hypothetical protein
MMMIHKMMLKAHLLLTTHPVQKLSSVRSEGSNLQPRADDHGRRDGCGVRRVPPALWDTAGELNNETTLYGQTLHVEATAENHDASQDWHELLYEPETNRAIWRRRRGETTPDHLREEFVSEYERKRDE